MVHELYGSALSQQFTTPNDGKVRYIEYVRPHLYKQGSPSGNVYCQIHTTSPSGVLATSESLVATSVDTEGNEFFHGYVRFSINCSLIPNTTYSLSLNSSTTWDASAFIGWISDHDTRKYTPSYTPSNDAEYPLDFELWERKLERRDE